MVRRCVTAKACSHPEKTCFRGNAASSCPGKIRESMAPNTFSRTTYNIRMSRPFLTARWQHLFLANFSVSPELLRPRLHPDLELDTREGQAFVSLVAFRFLDTRVLGIGWPGYRNFAELNLRFYVRHQGERGVVFVREFVPQRLTAWLAR